MTINASRGGAPMKYQLLKLADRCEAISRRTSDLVTARELRELAAEIRQMSSEVEGQPAGPVGDPPSRPRKI
jgi:hypothetical protein